MTRVLVVGMTGVGKTSVGQAVGTLAGWPFVDSDALLERATGCTAQQLLAQQGEPPLRVAQSDLLTLLLSMPGPFVACVPSGAVLDERNRQRLRDGGHVVWLRASVSTLLRRTGRTATRGGPAADPRTVLEARADELEPLFAEIAHQELDMDQQPVSQAARQVLARLDGER